MNVHIHVDAPRVTPLLALAIESLAERVEGRIITSDMPVYDVMRSVAHCNWDDRPLLIARPANAPDVADVVDFARHHELEIAVRSGGHSVMGHSSCQHGVVIDLRDLQEIDIDLKTMTVWAGAGLTAAQLTAALDPHGVAVGFGDTGSVGIGGLTLGGGVGYLTRKFGLTIDSLIAAEIVTANGSILTVDDSIHPDLFWAIRGGGGNFGVVTRFRYKLNPLPSFTGGPLVLPATPETLAGFVAAAKAAPEELSTILMVMPAPPLPFLPPEVHGKTVLFGMMAYAGPASDAQDALAPFRALANPIVDLVLPGPYSMMYLPEEPNAPKPSLSIRTLFAEGLGLADAEAILQRLDLCDAPMRMAQIRVLGGAAARVPHEATAYAHRDADLLVAFMALDGSVSAAQRHEVWADGCVAAVGGAKRGTYVNFLASEGQNMLRDTYRGGTWDRLRTAKAKYDPTNMFSRNQNIPPA